MSDNKVKLNGIFKQGYGISPKAVMRDKNLSIEAKAIYAYISSYSGSGVTAFPSVDLMCHDLGISRNRFNKHRKLLEDYGYITVRQEVEYGKFKGNMYTINLVPTLQNATSENATSENPSSENEATNNNNVNNNNINKNNTTTPIPPKGADEAIPLKKILDAYHEKLPELPRVVVFTDKRKKQLSARWKEDKSRQTIEWWTGYFEYVSSIPFLNGQNNRNWKADFEWLTNQNNLAKVIEGKYENE